jgi:alpha-glucosidase (family GH31 glycosyl hydrolase)
MLFISIVSAQSSLMELTTTDTSYTLTDKSSGTVLVESAKSGTRSCSFLRDGVLKVSIDQFYRSYHGYRTEILGDNGEAYYGAKMHTYANPKDDFTQPQLNSRGMGVEGDWAWAGQSAQAPFVMTNRGWAVYAPQSTGEVFHFDSAGGITMQCDTSFYYIIYGPTYRDMLQRYCDLAGAPLMPPLWAFGLFGWYDDSDDETDYRTMKRAIDLQIPATAFWADNPAVWYYENWVPDYRQVYGPAALVDSANAMGYRFLVWTAPHLGGSHYVGSYMEGCERIKTPQCLDKLDTYLKQNVGVEQYNIQGFKIDREADYSFGYRFWEQSAKSLQEVHGDDWFIFSRGLYDEFRQFSALWNGDCNGEIWGYKLSHIHLLRAGALMFPMCGEDVGGYNKGNIWNDLNWDVNCRRMAHGAYTPFMETPSGLGWSQDQTYNEEARKFCREHHLLMPYNRSMMYQAHLTGFPVMCALEFMFPEDGRFGDTWREYMFGSEILCGPVFEENVTDVEVKVPEGEWVNYHDRTQVVAGKSAVTLDAPLDIMPQLIRAGAIIAKGNIYKGNQQWIPDWKPQMSIEFFPAPSGGQDRKFPYYTGSGIVPIAYSMNGSDVSISFGDLQLGAPGNDGVLKVYCASYTGAVTDGGAAVSGVRTVDTLGGTMVEIPFDGATEVTISGVTSFFSTTIDAQQRNAIYTWESANSVAPGRTFDSESGSIPGALLPGTADAYRIFDVSGRCFIRTAEQSVFHEARRRLPQGVYIVQYAYPHGIVRSHTVTIER